MGSLAGMSGRKNGTGADTSVAWTGVGTIHVGTFRPQISSRAIMAFDLDGTIIKTKSRKVMPVDSNDWEFRNEHVEQTMSKLATSQSKIRLVIAIKLF